MLQRLCLILYLFLAIMSCLSLKAQKVIISPEPIWLYKVNPDLSKVPDARSVSNGYYLELVERQTSLIANTTYTHLIRNIINESGVQNASEVSVTFDPAFQRLVYHTVDIIRDGKRMNTFSLADVKVIDEEKNTQNFLYSGLKRAYILLKDVRVNDRIEFSYSLVGFNPVFDNKLNTHIYFQQSNFILNYLETLITQPDRSLLFKYFNGAPPVKDTLENKRRIYYWKNPPLVFWEEQPGTPSWFDNSSYVTVTEYSSWKEVADWALKTFNNYNFPLPQDVLNKMAEWRLKAKGDKDVFAGYAIQFVQNEIRYLGLEIGANTHRPHSPAQVCKARYGDCKDKALVLATILQKEDIPAYVVLVNTATGTTLTDAAPGPKEFNHAIVAIERSPGYIYIDATSTSQRGPLKEMYVPAYGFGLIVKSGEDRLQPVKPGKVNSLSIKETIYAKYNEAGESSLEVSTNYKGGAADDVRSSIASTSKSEIGKGYIDYYKKLFEGIKLTSDLSFQDDSAQNNIVVKEQYSIPALWHIDKSKNDAFSIHAQPITDRLPDPSTAYKNAPIALSYPIDVNYTMEVNMPDQWTFPGNGLTIKNDSYEFEYTSFCKGDVIRLDYHFKTLKDHIPESERELYESDYKRITDVLSFNLFINRKASGNKTGNHFGSTLVNQGIIYYSILLGLLLIYLFTQYNRRGADVMYTSESAWPLGGWTIVLGISIISTVIVQFMNIVKGGYFNAETLQTLGAQGGVQLQSLLYIELTVFLTGLIFSSAMLYWYLKRRDIFPAMFIWYAGFLLVSRLVLIIGYNVVTFPQGFDGVSKQGSMDFLRTCVYVGVWTTYIIRSERVKSTFLKEYK